MRVKQQAGAELSQAKLKLALGCTSVTRITLIKQEILGATLTPTLPVVGFNCYNENIVSSQLPVKILNRWLYKNNTFHVKIHMKTYTIYLKTILLSENSTIYLKTILSIWWSYCLSEDHFIYLKTLSFIWRLYYLSEDYSVYLKIVLFIWRQFHLSEDSTIHLKPILFISRL